MKKKRVLSIVVTSLVLSGVIFCGYKYRQPLGQKMRKLGDLLKFNLDMDYNEEV